MKFWTTDDAPAPQRKRKLIVSALEEHQEYIQMKQLILSGRMRPQQSAIITMGPEDAKKLRYTWPWRTAVDNLRRLVTRMGWTADYHIRKYQTATKGVWAVQVTYEPPITNVVPREVAVEKRRPGRPLGKKKAA